MEVDTKLAGAHSPPHLRARDEHGGESGKSKRGGALRRAPQALHDALCAVVACTALAACANDAAPAPVSEGGAPATATDGGSLPNDGGTHAVGGSVTGLTRSGLVLSNAGETLTIPAQATSFRFASRLPSGSHYDIAIVTQPSGQTCTLSSGSGTVLSADVTTVALTCVSLFAISGTIKGLTGNGLVLQNNGGDDLSVASGATSFAFAKRLVTGQTYAVTVKTSPTGQRCWVAGSGGSASATSAPIVVTCETGARIFLTSTVYDGNLGGLAGADAKCQARANAASLGGNWKAILSTRTVDARDHVDGTIPRFNVDGSAVMGANKMFSQSPTAPADRLLHVILDEFGHAVVGNINPFAGGGPDGRHAEPSQLYGLGWDDACQDWTSTTGTTTCGYNNVTTGAWFSGCGAISCIGYVNGVGLHCVEDPQL